MYRLNRIMLVALASLLFVSCYKQELIPFKKAGKKLKDCSPSYFVGVPAGEEAEPFTAFTKEFGTDGKVTQVIAPDLQLTLSDSLKLDLHYSTTNIYFTNNSIPEDTVITAVFDNQGKLVKMIGRDGYNFATTEYLYTKNRLSSIKVFGIESNFVYDDKGNVIKYQSTATGGLDNTEFEYDRSVTVTDQLYIDYVAGWVYNMFTLSQIMNWTPDLKPVNKRTRAKIYFDQSEVWYDVEFTDHRFDGQGRLISYNAGPYKMMLGWNCR